MANVFEKCSELITWTSDYKNHCRNSDQIVCLEACAKTAHAALNLSVGGNESAAQRLLPALRATCEWCDGVCARLHVGTQRACCRSFHECTAHIAQAVGAGSEESRREPLSESALHRLADACGNMLYRGMLSKSRCLVDGAHTNASLANAESTLHLCSAVRFLCHNAAEQLDTSMVQVLRECADTCGNDDFCQTSARKLVKACDKCMPAA